MALDTFDPTYGTQDPSALFQNITQQNRGQGALGQINQGATVAGFNPQMQRAQAIQSRLKEIMSNVPQEDNEDPLDYQERVAHAVSSGMVSIAPDVALRANEQAVKLAQAKAQQASLQAETGQRESETVLRREQIAKEAQDNSLVLVRTDKKDQFGFPIPTQFGDQVSQFDAQGNFRKESAQELQEQVAAAKAAGIPFTVRTASDYNSDKSRLMEIKGAQLAQQSMMRYLATIQGAQIRAQAGGAGMSTLTPDAIRTGAIETLYDPKTISLYSGMGQAGNANKTAVANARAQFMADNNIEPEDLAAWRAQIHANTKTMGTMQTNLSQLSVADQLIQFNGNRLMALIQDVDATGVPAVEGLRRKLIAAGGMTDGQINQKVNELRGVLQTWQSEVARAISGNPNMTGVLSDSARHDIAAVGNGSMDAPSMINNIKRMEAETAFKKQGYITEIKNLSGGIRALPGQPNAAPSNNAAPVAAGGEQSQGVTPPPASATQPQIDRTGTSADGKTKLYHFAGKVGWFKDQSGNMPYGK